MNTSAANIYGKLLKNYGTGLMNIVKKLKIVLLNLELVLSSLPDDLKHSLIIELQQACKIKKSSKYQAARAAEN